MWTTLLCRPWVRSTAKVQVCHRRGHSAPDGGGEERGRPREKLRRASPVLEAVKAALGDQVKGGSPVQDPESPAPAALSADGPCLSGDGALYARKDGGRRAHEKPSGCWAQRRLRLCRAKGAVDAGDQATVEKYAKLLYGQALLLADLPLEDPAEYAQLVSSLMA